VIARTPLETERLWLICWSVDGEGAFLRDLQDSATLQELAELIETELDGDNRLLRIHEFDVRAPWSDAIDVAQAGSLFEEFVALSSDQLSDHVSQFRRGLAGRDWPESKWVSHLMQAAEQLTNDDVLRDCQALARQQLLTDRRDVA